jgi:hypothetical protein
MRTNLEAQHVPQRLAKHSQELESNNIIHQKSKTHDSNLNQ